MPTMPGITLYPARLSTVVPGESATSAPASILVMRPFSTTRLRSATAAAPVPSMIRTCVSTTVGDCTRTKRNTSGDNVGVLVDAGVDAFTATAVAEPASTPNNRPMQNRCLLTAKALSSVCLIRGDYATRSCHGYKLTRDTLHGLKCLAMRPDRNTPGG